MKKRFKVLFISNIPSPYRVDFFNELGKYVDLTVLFEIDSSTERNISWKKYHFYNFTGIILKGKRTSYDTAFCPKIIKYIKKNLFEYIFVTTIASLTSILAVSWMKMRKIPYFYEGDGGIAFKKNGFKALIKKYIISSAKICLSTTKDFDNYCITYGADKKRIVRYPFSSVYDEYVINSIVKKEKKYILKEKLGIPEENCIISVGQIIHRKGFDNLITAFSNIYEKGWGLYIVGGECTQELKEVIKENVRKNVHFINFIAKDELKKYYMASDIFVLPTRYDPWGLVVNEAMANGLPIITTYQCGAGNMMVINGGNGYLYDCEDICELEKYIKTLMDDESAREYMGKKSIQTAHNYTLEQMVNKHLEIMESISQYRT